MVSSPQLNVRMRRVCIELRRLRCAAQLTLHQAARRVGHSASTLSKAESYGTGLNRDLLIELLIAYKVTDPDARKAVLKMYDSAHEPGLIDRGNLVINDDTATWAGFEAHATAIRNYQQMLIPGLLQTFPYARAVISSSPQLSEQEIGDRTTARIARQALLRMRHKPDLYFIVHEAALREAVGDAEVMHGQLVHLVEMNARWGISVRILPFGVGAHPGMNGPFVVMDYKRLPSLVLLENKSSDVYLEEEPDVDAYNYAWQGIDAVALTPADSMELIGEIAAGL